MENVWKTDITQKLRQTLENVFLMYEHMDSALWEMKIAK